jgi:hypothetical protein
VEVLAEALLVGIQAQSLVVLEHLVKVMLVVPAVAQGPLPVVVVLAQQAVMETMALQVQGLGVLVCNG